MEKCRHFYILKAFIGALLLTCGAARAQTITTCIPNYDQSFTQQYPSGTIPYTTYQVPNKLLMTSQSRHTKFMNLLLNVPQSVAQQLQSKSSADAYFHQIKPQYHEGLLNENGCPILYEPRAASKGFTVLTLGVGAQMKNLTLGPYLLTIGMSTGPLPAISNFAPLWSR